MPNTVQDKPGRRERRRLEIRDRLYTAAIDLIVERGFDATTMDEIAERADVARATAFNYFPQKIAFLHEWGERRRAHVAEVMAAEHAENRSAAERLRRYLAVLAELNTASRRATVTLMDASVRLGNALRLPNLDPKLTEFIEAGQRTGEFRPDVDATQAGTLLAAGYFSAVLRWISTEPEPFDLPRYLDDLLDLVLRGLTT
jgi:AcrR family transcriptional regulator